MVKTRHSLFETNSSSCHSFTAAKDKTVKTKCPSLYHKDGKISEIFPEAYEMDSKLRMMEQSDLYIRLEVFIWFLDKWLFMFAEEGKKE